MKNKGISSKYTDKELAEALIFPVKLTAAQKKEAARQLAIARKTTQRTLSEKDRLILGLSQLKFKMEDYIRNKEFDPDFTFSYFLKQYVELLRVKRKEFASEIGIDETLLSQFINQHRMLPEYMAIRLEIHSSNSIPAAYWFKIVEKQKEHQLSTDTAIRKKERKHVRRRLAIGDGQQ